MRWRRKLPARGWFVAGAAALLAVGLALTAPAAAPKGREDAAARAAMFREIAAAEWEIREKAARAFPGDPWSADDDFHNHEQRLARAIAARRGVPIGAVLHAIDEGLREHWAEPNPTPLLATVPPCHPRPIY